MAGYGLQGVTFARAPREGQLQGITFPLIVISSSSSVVATYLVSELCLRVVVEAVDNAKSDSAGSTTQSCLRLRLSPGRECMWHKSLESIRSPQHQPRRATLPAARQPLGPGHGSAIGWTAQRLPIGGLIMDSSSHQGLRSPAHPRHASTPC